MLLRPLWVQPGLDEPDISYPLVEDRQGMLGQVFSRPGVLDYDGGDLAVTPAAAGGMAVDVAPGRAAIAGTDPTDQGTYVCNSTATETVSLARPSSGARVYAVVAEIRDQVGLGSTASDWVLHAVYDPDDPDTAPAPANTITLAHVAVTASSSRVTAAAVTDRRPRATVGTPAVTGVWGETGIAPVWGEWDPTRPLTWMKKPDGWVMLSGWFRRTADTTAVVRNEFWSFDRSRGWGAGAPVLPPEARPVGGVRDFQTITSNGDLHLCVFPGGQMSYRFQFNTTLTAGLTWISFDGCFYRTNSF